jgi:hypothetical protein
MNKFPLKKKEIKISPSAIARCCGIQHQNHPGNLLREVLDPVTACWMVDMLSDNNSIHPIATWIIVMVAVN